MFENLFSPILINKCEIKNRIAYPSLGLLFSFDGKINEKYINFFREKAAGGAGIVTVGPVGFDMVGGGPVTMLLSEDSLPDFKNLARIIHDEGAKAWVQLYHAGAYSYSEKMGGDTPIAPSAIYSRYSKSVPREMTIEDIKKTENSFVKSALLVKEAGFDGVEIIGSAGYLITQFLSPLKNNRTDEYGGSFENRIRFPREIIEMMRKEVGPDYPLSIRMAGNDFVEGSNTSRETPDIARVYEKAGVDLINVTGGWHESHIPQLPMAVPRGAYTYLALNIKRAVSIPVMASNRITTPEEAETIIKDGMADMVNLGRVLIADPYWPKKAEQGRVDEIHKCIACNQGCTDKLFSVQPVTCLVNARAGYEGERNIKKAIKSKNIMVVGAGPGGLEAAIRASESGHHVDLYEKESDIGGQLWIASTPPHKHELMEIIHYYRAMIKKLHINLHLNTMVTIEMIKKNNPDHLIVAEGAEPLKPPIKGIDDTSVLSAWDILKNDPKVGKNIAIIGGGAVGLETAEFLASKGTISPETLYFLFKYQAETVERLRELITKGSKDVTIFEMLPKIGQGIGRSTKWIHVGNIERLGIKIVPGAKVISIENGVVTFDKDGKQSTMKFDTVINAVGSKSIRKISEAVKDCGIPYTVIGDSIRPAQIIDAIHEGFLAVMGIS